jgi:hypothetical protein
MARGAPLTDLLVRWFVEAIRLRLDMAEPDR